MSDGWDWAVQLNRFASSFRTIGAIFVPRISIECISLSCESVAALI